MELIGQLWKLVSTRKKYWLLPVIVVTTVLGSLLVLAKGSALAPFIYTLF